MRRRPLPPVREEAPSKPWRQLCASNLLMYSVVASVGVLSYSNSFTGDFVHDDIPAIVTNGDVRGSRPLLALLHNDFWGTPMSDPSSHKSYRPLTTLSFRLNLVACGWEAWGWHAPNVALHAACCALVARVALLARMRRPFAALAAILFAVHPVHTEAVAGIVGRADVLACFFFLISVLLYHGRERPNVWSSVAAAALSTLAKETGLTALVFNLAFDCYRCWLPAHSWSWSTCVGARSCVWRGARAALALLALAAARLALLHGALPAFSAMDNPAAFHPSLLVRVLTFCYLASVNWWLCLCPTVLSHDWQLGSVPLVTSLSDARNLLTAAALAMLLTLVYRCLVDLEVQRHTPVVCGLLLLVVPYMPASNLPVTVGFVLAERVLYIPSVGSVLLTAYGMQLLWQRLAYRRVLVAAVLVLLVTAAARTQLRNRDWRSRESLLRADLSVLPHNAKLHYNFANFLKDTDHQEGAIKHYREALRLWPSYASAHNNLGTLLGADCAEQHFLMALRHNRDHLNAHLNLGRLYRKQKRLPEALSMLERCIALEPRFVQAYLELLHLKRDDRERRQLLQRLIDLEPRNWEHRMLYGHWYKERGLSPLAVQQYTAALALSLRAGRGTPAVQALARVLRSQGQAARLLQFVTRWHACRSGAAAAWQRAAAASAWRLRAELQGRAARYERPPLLQPTSTCLHHTQLEVPPTTDQRALVSVSDSGREHCKHAPVSKVSIPVDDKVMVNKSEVSHRQRTCPLHRKKKIKDPTPFVSEHYVIKTY